MQQRLCLSLPLLQNTITPPTSHLNHIEASATLKTSELQPRTHDRRRTTLKEQSYRSSASLLACKVVMLILHQK